MIEKQLLEVIRIRTGKKFDSIEKALDEFARDEILDMWLKYEGISGYTYSILDAVKILYLTPSVQT